MTTHLVTFASDEYTTSAFKCIDSASAHGADGVSIVVDSGLKLSAIYRENERLFSAPRGCGYWAWKPWVIYQTMMDWQETGEGFDYLIYSDAGIEFTNNVNHIIDRMDQDIFLFGNNWEHAHWCKGDIAYTCWPDNYGGEAGSVANVWGRYGKQVQASVILFRVSDWSRQFVAEWLKWCLFEDGRLIDDSPSRHNNHPEFRENRHDQAILTTLAYREGLRLHYWPASYNDGAFTYEKLPEYARDDYPVLFNHHRKRNVDWEQAA